jgi:hypothetical protein
MPFAHWFDQSVPVNGRGGGEPKGRWAEAEGEVSRGGVRPKKITYEAILLCKMLVNNEDKAPFHMTRAGLSFATRAAAWAGRAVAPSALESAVLPQTSDQFRAMKDLSEYLGFFVALVSRLSCPRCDSSWADGSGARARCPRDSRRDAGATKVKPHESQSFAAIAAFLAVPACPDTLVTSVVL